MSKTPRPQEITVEQNKYHSVTELSHNHVLDQDSHHFGTINHQN